MEIAILVIKQEDTDHQVPIRKLILMKAGPFVKIPEEVEILVEKMEMTATLFRAISLVKLRLGIVVMETSADT